MPARLHSPAATQGDFHRQSVNTEYDADGKNRRLYARGLRTAEGLAFKPGTNELWVIVNNRDNIAYSFHKDWNGNGMDAYGKVIQSYVDGPPTCWSRYATAEIMAGRSVIRTRIET